MYLCPMNKRKDNLPASTDHYSKVHQPHDKFVRALLQEKEFTVQLLEYVLPSDPISERTTYFCIRVQRLACICTSG